VHLAPTPWDNFEGRTPKTTKSAEQKPAAGFLNLRPDHNLWTFAVKSASGADFNRFLAQIQGGVTLADPSEIIPHK
jgi:hypothetical protein